MISMMTMPIMILVMMMKLPMSVMIMIETGNNNLVLVGKFGKPRGKFSNLMKKLDQQYQTQERGRGCHLPKQGGRLIVGQINRSLYAGEGSRDKLTLLHF